MNELTWQCTSLEVSRADGTRVVGAGAIVQNPVGGIEVRVEVPGAFTTLDEFADDQCVLGVTTTGESVRAENCYPIRADGNSTSGTTLLSLTPARVDITTPGYVPQVDEHHVYLKGVRCLGTARFTDGTRALELRPLKVDPKDRNKGLIRGVLVIANPPGSEEGREELLRHACMLLSLAQRCRIYAPRRVERVGGRTTRTTLFPNDFALDSSNPLIPWDAGDLGRYMERCFPACRQHDAAYELERLIWFYCRSVDEQYAEVKFIFASVFMEAFKFFWALNVGKKPAVLKANGLIRGFQKALNRHGDPVLYGFEEFLTEACASLGYNPTFTFVEDRNALFHSGAPGAHQRGAGGAWAAIKPELVTLYRQIDDILLRVLGYQGPIHRWDAPDALENFP